MVKPSGESALPSSWHQAIWPFGVVFISMVLSQSGVLKVDRKAILH
jgi:hypothetical protein